jgi:hypothetical protein
VFVPGIWDGIGYSTIIVNVSPTPRLSAFNMQVEVDLTFGQFRMCRCSKDLLDCLSNLALLSG